MPSNYYERQRAHRDHRQARATIIADSLCIAQSQRPARFALAMWLLGEITPATVQRYREGAPI